MFDVPDFDEAVYLAANPDVRAAVESGDCVSGLAHYLAYGHHELRRGAPPLPDEPDLAQDCPPRHLRVRVHGALDVTSFQKVGRDIATNIMDLATSRLPLSKDSKILDFGCGCGRIMTQFQKLAPGLLFGTDIDREAIDWCQQNLNIDATFHVNEHLPPLPFDDNTFDMIYSISIFSHLPEDMQSAWLAELNRVLAPGGVALLTVHGSSLFPRAYLGPNLTAQFERDGFLYAIGDGTDGLPHFYQTSFNSEEYVNATWSKFLRVEEVLGEAAGAHQDMVVCRKKTLGGRG